jgi:hypothetical protein
MHLTHTMRSVTAVSVRSDQSGVDQALRIDHRDGWIVIRFAPADRPQRKPTAS